MDLGQKAKKTLTEYVPIIDKRLAAYLDEEIKLNFGFNSRQKEMIKNILGHAKEHNLRASKRLRGSYVNYAYMLRGGRVDQKIWNAAMGVELIHTGLLMHDDFMDRDDIRRGGPTTHKFFEKKFNSNSHLGESVAVDLGDTMLFLGLELILSSGNMDALRQTMRGVTHTTYGQAYDLILEAYPNWTEDDIITLHKAKTAIYTYQNPLFIGAYLGGIKDKKIFDILHDYSMDGGVAFQLQDDILGVFGTPEKTGKSADSDLLQGKCTLLVLKLLENGTNNQKAALNKVWEKLKASRSNLDNAKQAIMDSGSYLYSKETAIKYAKKAANTAAKLRTIKNLNSEAIDYIQGIAEYMVNREV